MTYVWSFCVLIIYVLVCSSAVKPEKKKTLSLCELTVGKDIDPPKQGPKGEKGDNGLKGEKGENGRLGYPGPPGLKGPQGIEGPPGFPNPIKGVIGDKGDIGLKGLRGEMGLSGPWQPDGKKGSRGDKGYPGSIGPPGRPGPDGFCPCKQGNRITDNDETIIAVCRDSLTVKTGNYTLKLSDPETSDPYYLKVQCVLRHNTTVLTCIPKIAPSKRKTYTYRNISTGFWLSNEGLKLNELYGLERETIKWFLEHSNSAFQYIRYHCYNSNPFSRDNIETSLLLLTWNDNTIGPMPTTTKPFFYSIDYDGCSDNPKDTWGYTDIKLVSTSPQRVPVIDFFIRDVQNEMEQKIKIEHIKLCFD